MEITKEQLIAKAIERRDHARKCLEIFPCDAEYEIDERIAEIALEALTANTEIWEIENPGEGTYYMPHAPAPGDYRAELVRAEYILKPGGKQNG